MLVGYIRVSTAEQNTVRQEVLMESLGVEILFIDKASGKNAERPELIRMMEFVRQGDTIVVEFVSKKESIDTSSPTGKFMLTVFGAVAELERAYILERQKEGIAVAKAKGIYKGRPPKELPDFEHIVTLWQVGEITAVEAARRLQINPSTFYRKLKGVKKL